MLVAHRGFRTANGENRLIDFQKALLTCKAVEFDIRMTKDDNVIIFHDHDFRRIGKLNQTVKSLTYEQITNIPFFIANPMALPIKLTSFIYQLADKYSLINVEIKANYYTIAEYKIIYQQLLLLMKTTNAEIIVSSFSHNTLVWISSLPKKFKKAYLTENLNKIDYDLLKKFDYLNPYLGLVKQKRYINKIKQINLPLNIWTLKNNIDVEFLIATYGKLINSFISDNPKLQIPK